MKRTGITKKIQAALMLLACPFAAFASQDGGEDYHPLNSVEDETNSIQSVFCGFVSDEKGQPMSDANIRLYSTRPFTSSIVKTDASGYFSIPAEKDVYYLAEITAKNSAKYHVAPFLVRDILNVKFELFNSITFLPDVLSTIILPITPDPTVGKYYCLKAIEGNNPVFVRELHPTAGLPYLFIADHEFTLALCELDLSSSREQVILSEGDKRISFIGSFESILVGGDSDTKECFHEYVIDKTPDCGEERSLDGERSYYRLGACHGYFSSNLGNFNQFILREGTTDMIVSLASRQTTEIIFDLQGRRINGVPQRGMYIQNGRKYVVK